MCSHRPTHAFVSRGRLSHVGLLCVQPTLRFESLLPVRFPFFRSGRAILSVTAPPLLSALTALLLCCRIRLGLSHETGFEQLFPEIRHAYTSKRLYAEGRRPESIEVTIEMKRDPAL